MNSRVTGHDFRLVTATLGILLLMGVLQLTAPRASALITESFEGSFGNWVWDCNEDVAYFDGALTQLYAYDGLYSVKLAAHGLPSPPMSVWIERTVQAPPNTAINVGVTFQLYSGDPSLETPRSVLAYLGVNDPEVYADFNTIGQTDQLLGWYEYSYQTTVNTGPSGQIWAAVGFYNQIIGFKNYYFDLVNLTGVSDDLTPPVITNLRPTDSSIVSDNTPLIAADYSDSSGIDTSRVILMVDSGIVTPLATVTQTGISYTPSILLSEGPHTVDLDISDNSAYHNRATESWSFVVDSIPPAVTNLQPTNQSTITDTTPFIGASYSDASGVNTSTVVLKVDTLDVTASASVGANDIMYTSALPLPEGMHNIALSVRDNAAPPNTAIKTWWFVIDSLPPAITNKQPPSGSTVSDSTPVIGADYTDPSGIDVSSVVLKVDSVDVTSFSTVTATGVRYTPSVPLLEDLHGVYLEVRDNSANHIKGIATWSFSIDSRAPTITNLRPVNWSDVNDNTPQIAANYFDTSGIDTSSVVLEVDSIDVTASAGVTAGGVTYTPFLPLADGIHDVSVAVRDNSPNHLLSVAIWHFKVDTTPPTAALDVLSPKYDDTGSGKTYVTSSTMLNLTANDGTGVGVQTIWYTYYASGESQPAFGVYTSEFAISSSEPDGLILVKFKSTDRLGNEGLEATAQLYLDNSAPASEIQDYDPQILTYINNALASFTIQATDGGSGLQSISYGIDDLGCSNAYSGSFIIGTVGDGEHRIYHKSVDRLGNAEVASYITVFLDTTPPTADAGDDVEISPGDTVDFNGTGSSDGASGSGIVNYTWTFTYEGATVTLYAATPEFVFWERGDYEVTLTVRDRAGNTASDTMMVTFASEVTPGGESSQFPWWLVLVAVVIAVLLLSLLLLAWKRRKEGEEKTPEEEVPTEEAQVEEPAAEGVSVEEASGEEETTPEQKEE